MQRVSIMGEKKESNAYGKAIKGTAKEEAGVPYKGRSIRKKVEEGRREGSARGQATRSTARIEEKFGRRIEEESRGTL